MTARCARWSLALACVAAVSLPPALAKTRANDVDANGTQEAVHTFTWWCVDVNDLLHFDGPVVIGAGVAAPPSPSPIADTCTTPYPVSVPSGSRFAIFRPVGWGTNNTYPPEFRTLLQGMGYNFHSQSPAEDFMSKFVEIRVQVFTWPDGQLVQELRFDPRKNFRLVRAREFFGRFLPFEAAKWGVPVDELGHSPYFHFRVIVGPLPPGEYRAVPYWTLSDWHSDGLLFDEEGILPAGESQLGGVRFTVVP